MGAGHEAWGSSRKWNMKRTLGRPRPAISRGVIPNQHWSYSESAPIVLMIPQNHLNFNKFVDPARTIVLSGSWRVWHPDFGFFYRNRLIFPSAAGLS
jgi:hypothetical protein